MVKFSETYKRVVLIQLGLCLIAFVIGGVFIPFDGSFSLAPSFFSYALGIGLGFLFSCLKLYMLEKSLEKSVDMEKKDASSYARLMYMARYFITLVVLGAAAFIKEVSLLGMFLSIILLQPAAIIAGIREKRLKEEA
ncbi:MAG: ATP synthase subunit I [Clostridiales bacterium]|nr:ATP synthase subunit I [Clostridiales bacterium]MCD8215434.1 ATP synthase subunit I [Clostridiales bacterium]